MGQAPLNKQTLRKKTIDLMSLEDEELNKLGESLYHQVQQKVFCGVDYDTFYKEVIVPEANEATISLYFTPRNELVGYLQYSHTFCELLGKPSVLVRSATGFLSAYRSRTHIGMASAKHLTHLYLRFPFRSVYIFTSPISPISYKMIGRTFSEYWPNPWIETPTAIHQLIHEICVLSNFTPSDDNPMVRQVGWEVNDITTQSFSHNDQLTRFYIKNNPHYNLGYGLMTVIPIHTKNILSGSQRLLSKQWKKLWEQQTTRAYPHESQ